MKPARVVEGELTERAQEKQEQLRELTESAQ